MTETPVMSDAQMSAAESLLAEVWGVSIAVRAVEKIGDGDHVARLRLSNERSVVLKRRRAEDLDDRAWVFDAEVAALDFLNGMPRGVAPRLFGTNDQTGILLMEDLGAGSSLAHSLLGGGRGRAEADLVRYARALAAVHSWSIGRSGEFAQAWARRGGDAPPARSVSGTSGSGMSVSGTSVSGTSVSGTSVSGASLPEPEWMGAIATRKESFLTVMAQLGLAVDGAGDDVDELISMLRGTAATGLVHGDLCPDNTHIVDGVCRIFDFESSGWGAVALDTAYLLAPFPSCWCFAGLPSTVAEPALRAYREAMAAGGIDLGPDWDADMTAAMAGWIVARGQALGQALDEDMEFGTTTMRPRLLTLLRSFIDAADRSGALPRLRDLAAAAHQELSGRWPDAVLPRYPAVADPGEVLARAPEGRESV